MNNIHELRRELSELFERVKTNDLDTDRAREMNNAAGKILRSVGAEMMYSSMRNEVPNIPFMHRDGTNSGS